MNLPNARERILEAATKVFADKSFDGSRIEDISRSANVPKSLIYYHFKSKDEILEILTRRFIDEYLGLISDNAGESHREKADEIPDRMKNVYYEFGMKNADLVRVILIDSFKKSNREPVLFKVIEAMIAKEQEAAAENNEYDVQERRIAEFFTSFLPNCAYILFADSWSQFFALERSAFNKLFMKVYMETHGAYHKNHI